jgi:hypothetical protein
LLRGGDDLSTTQYNVRLPDVTTKQIQRLIELTGMTQTQLMIVALDRMFQAEEKPNREESPIEQKKG